MLFCVYIKGITLNTYQQLIEQLNVQPDRRGWVPIECPSCGENRQKKSAFNKLGHHCFVCGANTTLAKLAEKMNIDTTLKSERRVFISKPPNPRYWHREPERWLKRTLAHPRRVELWQQYRPFTMENVAAYQLGIGVVPSTPCQHDRLTYPYQDGDRVTLRGRAIDCGCPKWLSAGGSTAALWGIERLTPDAVVVLCESPIDAMLLMQYDPHLVAVAGTAGASTWRSEWTQAIVNSRPAFLLVAYDNDLQGQATGETRQSLTKAWLQKRRKLPVANGPRVATEIARNGIKTFLFPWKDAPPKADIGWLLTTMPSTSILSQPT